MSTAPTIIAISPRRMESLVEAALESFDARPAAAADELLAQYDRRFP